MPSLYSTLFSAATLLAFVAQETSAHTYLIKPRPRQSWKYNVGDSLEDGTGNGQGLCHLGDGTPTCCVSDHIPQMTTYQRGDTIDTHWWRNNHVAGYTRYSMVPIEQSNSQEAFDSQEAMLNYECAQVGCTATYGGSSPNNWNGGDSNGNKGWSNVCNGAFKIPYHVPDGTYTVQWVWFGQGNGNSANSPFQSCIDLVVKGGPTGAAPKCPLWKGGDTSEAGDTVCSYVSVDNPTYQGTCVNANQCSGKYSVGLPAGLEECVNGNAPKTWPLGMVASSGVPNTFDSYTASGSASTGSASTSSNGTSTSSSGDDDTTSSSGSSSSSSGSSSSGSSSSGSSSSGSSSSGSSSGSTKKKCSSNKRRHYGRRSPVRRHGLAEIQRSL